MASNPRSLLYALCILMVFIDGRVYVTEAATGSTNEYDVQGLNILATQFPILSEMVTDPCYPVKLTWITCSDDASPRVTQLNLGDRILAGTLPNFSSMVALEEIDLGNNFLTGLIPEFLGKFPKLKELNLANNLFTGPIPSSIMQNKNLKTDVSGNDGVYVSSSSSKKKSNKLPIILGVTILVFVVIWIAFGIFTMMRQRERKEAVISTAAQSNATSATNTPNIEERPIRPQHAYNNP